MKYITVKLTEDQVRWLISATESEISYWNEQKERADSTGWNEQREAFGRRLLTKLIRVVTIAK